MHIMAATGHRSLKEVERNTPDAERKNLARAATHKLEQNEGDIERETTAGQEWQTGDIEIMGQFYAPRLIEY
jgi:hypothetical protein